jgi:hypothetical protein
MKKFILSTTAMVMISSSAAYALADLTTESIVAEFATAQKIEIKRGAFTTKIEVIIDGVKTEYTFNNTTLEEVKREVYTLTAEEIEELKTDYGIEVEYDDDDDRDDDEEDDDRDEEEDDDDDDRDDDDKDDDRRGDRDGNDEDDDRDDDDRDDDDREDDDDDREDDEDDDDDD